MKKVKVLVSMFLSLAMFLTLASCSQNIENDTSDTSLPSIDELNIGEHTDIVADIKFVTFRTDIMDKLENYADEFHKIYPNVNISYEGIDDYEATTITYLTSV